MQGIDTLHTMGKPELSKMVPNQIVLKRNNTDTASACKKCEMKLSFQHILDHHEKVSQEGLKPFECSKSFALYSNIIHQISAMLKLQKNTCGSGLKRQEKVVHVARIVKHYSCKQCDKTFTNKDNLTVHQCYCPSLRPVVDSATNVETRMDLTNSEPNIQSNCKQSDDTTCNPEIKSKRKVKADQGAKTIKRPYPCKNCDKQFSERDMLIVHRYVCPKTGSLQEKTTENVRATIDVTNTESEADATVCNPEAKSKMKLPLPEKDVNMPVNDLPNIMHKAGFFFEQNCENSTAQKLKNMKTQAKFCSKTQGTGTFSKVSTKINSKTIGKKLVVPYFLAFLLTSYIVNLKILTKG